MMKSLVLLYLPIMPLTIFTSLMLTTPSPMSASTLPELCLKLKVKSGDTMLALTLGS